ncbi:chitin deacetylase 7-like [Artemia franciscana]
MKILLLFAFLGLVSCAPSVKVAEGCVQNDNCIEPACRCSSTAPPSNFDPSNPYEIPQIVFLTFDEAVTPFNYGNYTFILGERINPNGCPITMSFNVIHDFNDYIYLNDLYKRGNEIGDHSISRKTDLNYWSEADVETWRAEMEGLKIILSSWANIPQEKVKGSRAPFLQPGGDNMIEALIQAGIQYDMSFPTRNYIDPPMWPYTLDYRTTQDCAVPPCPVESHPGFWILPMVNLQALEDDEFCAMADSCPIMQTAEEQKNFLMTNFRRHYDTTRAPFGIHAHGAWFQDNPQVLQGYVDFLDEVLTYGDVYVINPGQVIEWMKNPTALADLGNFSAWSCDETIVAPCFQTVCEYYDVDGPETGGDRLVRGCLRSCPPTYPWVGNPEGN